MLLKWSKAGLENNGIKVGSKVGLSPEIMSLKIE